MIVAIVNPASAGGKTRQEWPGMKQVLEEELGEINVFLTEFPSHATELTRQALKSGAETLIAVGGDGLLHEVVNGFYEQGEPLSHGAKIAFIARGTGSDFVKSWHQTTSIREVAQGIRNKTSRPCDLIRIRLLNEQDSQEERYCINIADAGIGGLVVDMVNRRSKVFGGTFSFLVAGVQAALTNKNFPLRIEVDGKIVSDGTPHFLAAIANGRYFGGGMQMAPQAKLDDGLFDVVLVGDLNLPEKVRFAINLYKGSIGKLEKVHVLQGKHLKMTSPEPEEVFLEADGESIGTTDAEFNILPSALTLYV